MSILLRIIYLFGAAFLMAYLIKQHEQMSFLHVMFISGGLIGNIMGLLIKTEK